jgi:hypothetical protein
MKKISFFTAAFSGFLLLANTGAFSQTIGNDAIAYVDVAGKNSEFHFDKAASPRDKAVIVFNTKFAGAFNVLWSTYEKDKPVVNFETKEKKHMAFFSKKGKLLSTISYYTEEHLPKDILFQVKGAYYKKNIFSVTEVNTLGKTAYLIVMEDKTTWLHIKVLDGEITEEKLFIKG